MKIVAWNMQNKRDSWQFLIDRHQDYDFALVQEACTPPRYVRQNAADWDIPYERWEVKPKRYKQEVLRIADGWSFNRIDRDTISADAPAGTRLIRPRWRAAAVVSRPQAQSICLLCVVSGEQHSRRLANTVLAVRKTLRRGLFNPDVPMIVAGDLTTDVDRTPATFVDMEQIGLYRVGPEGANFINKPTRERPQDAWRTLNHVFVSADLIDRVRAVALNDPDDTSPEYWGPSDHCRIQIEIDGSPRDFTGSYINWSCRTCSVSIEDLIDKSLTDDHACDTRFHRARIIAAHKETHRCQPGRQSTNHTDYSNWSCDKCNWGTIERLVNYYIDRHPDTQNIPYRRIIGSHKAYHTRQANRQTTGTE